MSKKNLVFENSSTQYVELEFTDDEKLLVHWMNYPTEIVYHCETSQEAYDKYITKFFSRMLKNCNDIKEARTVLENYLAENPMRTMYEIRELQNKAFDLAGGYDEYFTGFFDALGWVLGDELDEEIWGENYVRAT